MILEAFALGSLAFIASQYLKTRGPTATDPTFIFRPVEFSYFNRESEVRRAYEPHEWKQMLHDMAEPQPHHHHTEPEARIVIVREPFNNYFPAGP